MGVGIPIRAHRCAFFDCITFHISRLRYSSVVLKNYLRLKKAIRYLSKKKYWYKYSISSRYIYDQFFMVFYSRVNMLFCVYFIIYFSILYKICEKWFSTLPEIYFSFSLFLFRAMNIRRESWMAEERYFRFRFVRVSLLEFLASASLSNFRAQRAHRPRNTSVRISSSCLAVVGDSFQR